MRKAFEEKKNDEYYTEKKKFSRKTDNEKSS
jgi:hypothetical protein